MIAGHYDAADRFGSISQSHDAAIFQIKDIPFEDRQTPRILDLGVGNAAFLEKLKIHVSNADFTGIDISGKMLACAKKRLQLRAIETSAAEAANHVSHHSQDLVLAHFINAYIPIHSLFNQADLLTKDDGYFSLITTTYESFPIAQRCLAEFIAMNTFMSNIVGHYYKSIVKNTTVASGKQELLDEFAKHNFEIIDHKRLFIPINLKDINELALFGIEGTWFLNSIAIRMLPKSFLINRIKRIFNKIFTFPYQDTHVIDIILAKKLLT